MKEACIIFPHQLFKAHPALKKGRLTILVEENLFFRQYNFHQKKLVLHRASMKAYEVYLKAIGFEVNYLETTDQRADVRELIVWLANNNFLSVFYADVVDDWLSEHITQCCHKFNLERTVFDTPNFLNTLSSVKGFFDKKKTYFQTAFYIDQRKQR
ncbi:MAG: cryptochrome/photolyase family protein, partial [Gloeobacteraceae cyanobacterium ES-bin-316]|nr:cryptochrome/photolyase family protein [Ferruginibacter sp.]